MIPVENFDYENIEAIKKTLDRDLQNNSHYDKAFTMLQNNSFCEVNITPESEEICAEALLK